MAYRKPSKDVNVEMYRIAKEADRLLREAGLTAQEVADGLKIKLYKVALYRQLLRLPSKEIERFLAGEITPSRAQVIARSQSFLKRLPADARPAEEQPTKTESPTPSFEEHLEHIVENCRMLADDFSTLSEKMVPNLRGLADDIEKVLSLQKEWVIQPEPEAERIQLRPVAKRASVPIPSPKPVPVSAPTSRSSVKSVIRSQTLIQQPSSKVPPPRNLPAPPLDPRVIRSSTVSAEPPSEENEFSNPYDILGILFEERYRDRKANLGWQRLRNMSEIPEDQLEKEVLRAAHLMKEYWAKLREKEEKTKLPGEEKFRERLTILQRTWGDDFDRLVRNAALLDESRDGDRVLSLLKSVV